MASEEPFSDCDTCQAIWLHFTDPQPRPSFVLEDAQNPSCPRHPPLIRAFATLLRDHERTSPLSRESPKPTDFGFWKTEQGNPHNVMLVESISAAAGLTRDLLLLHRPSDANHPGCARTLDPEWLDIDLASKWKHRCLSQHGANCHNPLQVPSTQPDWLVDVKNKCLVKGQGCGSYVALSYRWGDYTDFQVTTDILDILQQANSLLHPDFANKLPQILRHAMYLTVSMGERYLWIDLLCIVHGGHAATLAQLNLMSAIYANAIVTIVASDGDARTGIPGIPDISPARKLVQTFLPFGHETIVVRNSHLFDLEGNRDNSDASYFGRAWTYQEHTMSSRKLHFSKQEMHWQCRSAIWQEESIFGAEYDYYVTSGLIYAATGYPNLTSLAHIISQYNTRALSYDEDALNAIAGLLAVFSRTYCGGFLYGLPEMLFDRCLGWVPLWDFTNLTKRVVSKRPADKQLTETALPSWSWISWRGRFRCSEIGVGPVWDHEDSSEETFPITEWYTAASSKAESRRRIHSTWYENRDSYKDYNRPLPDGWTRHEAGNIGKSGDSRLWPERCGGYLFIHDRMPLRDNEPEKWYFPFPIPEINESTPFSTPQQTPYLFCKTKRTFLWAYRADYEAPTWGKNSLYLRRESSSQNIGRLQLQTAEQLARFPKVETDNDQAKGRLIELVAIYRSKIYSRTSDLPRIEYYHPPTLSPERYVVLWVEWRDEVAYRLACGHVDKEVWDSLDLENINLVLG